MRLFLFVEVHFPAVENTHSTSVDDAGIDKIDIQCRPVGIMVE